MRKILVLLIAITLLFGCTKEHTGADELLIEYYTLYEVSGVAQTGALTLYFGAGYTHDKFIASVTSLPSNGSWYSNFNILTLSGNTYKIDKNNDGHLWFHRGGVSYKFTMDGNNVQ